MNVVMQARALKFYIYGNFKICTLFTVFYISVVTWFELVNEFEQFEKIVILCSFNIALASTLGHRILFNEGSETSSLLLYTKYTETVFI